MALILSNAECERDLQEADSLNQSIGPLGAWSQVALAVLPLPVHDGLVHHIVTVGVCAPSEPWALISILLVSEITMMVTVCMDKIKVLIVFNNRGQSLFKEIKFK